ncbi:hypothetical protein RR46_13281 [Papilio xuthus]|uniref:Uncharacterized protein n=1 Tax=Papilio xuthus TaxID=66420 RepID=A0A194PLT1_PAPXU|nr:hypothetical protein RR46_13281 [Papilio xuthus]
MTGRSTTSQPSCLPQPVILFAVNKMWNKEHPDIKRQVCKKCRCILVNGVSAKMQLKTKNKRKSLQWKCNTCETSKTFPLDKNRERLVWLERAEAVVEVIA